MFIPRYFSRTEHDDYVLNVKPHLDRDTNKESVRVYDDRKDDPDYKWSNPTHVCLGWEVQDKFD